MCEICAKVSANIIHFGEVNKTNSKELYIYDGHTERDEGEGLEIYHVFADSVFFKQ